MNHVETSRFDPRMAIVGDAWRTQVTGSMWGKGNDSDLLTVRPGPYLLTRVSMTEYEMLGESGLRAGFAVDTIEKYLQIGTLVVRRRNCSNDG